MALRGSFQPALGSRMLSMPYVIDLGLQHGLARLGAARAATAAALCSEALRRATFRGSPCWRVDAKCSGRLRRAKVSLREACAGSSRAAACPTRWRCACAAEERCRGCLRGAEGQSRESGRRWTGDTWFPPARSIGLLVSWSATARRRAKLCRLQPCRRCRAAGLAPRPDVLRPAYSVTPCTWRWYA